MHAGAADRVKDRVETVLGGAGVNAGKVLLRYQLREIRAGEKGVYVRSLHERVAHAEIQFLVATSLDEREDVDGFVDIQKHPCKPIERSRQQLLSYSRRAA